jgi:hypothetical protein
LFFFYAGCSALCFLAGRNTCTLLDPLWSLTPRTPTEDAKAQDGTELNLLHEEIVQLGRDLQEALLLQRERQVELPAQVQVALRVVFYAQIRGVLVFKYSALCPKGLNNVGYLPVFALAF